jgi:hypothetical protein
LSSSTNNSVEPSGQVAILRIHFLPN